MSSSTQFARICSNLYETICSPQTLVLLKEKYKDVINSRRCLDCIRSVKDLVQVLEKRDYVNETNFQSLYEIARVLNISFSPVEDIQRNAYNGNISINRPRVSRQGKDKVYQYIASHIGQKWTDLARNLKVPEGTIDELSFRPTISSRVYEILKFHEENCDVRMWQSDLLHALEDARRRDLSREIQRIFDLQ